jgi:hypothetical protein
LIGDFNEEHDSMLLKLWFWCQVKNIGMTEGVSLDGFKKWVNIKIINSN